MAACTLNRCVLCIGKNLWPCIFNGVKEQNILVSMQSYLFCKQRCERKKSRMYAFVICSRFHMDWKWFTEKTDLIKVQRAISFYFFLLLHFRLVKCIKRWSVSRILSVILPPYPLKLALLHFLHKYTDTWTHWIRQNIYAIALNELHTHCTCAFYRFDYIWNEQ